MFNEPSEEQLITWEEVAEELRNTALSIKQQQMRQAINDDALPKDMLSERHGQVWDTKELTQRFYVHQFSAPFVFVTRRADGVTGTVMFQHEPRFYWGFKENRV